MTAANLEGLEVGEWKILKKRIKNIHDNSGAFSSCYEVENIKNNKKAFLKAFNIQYALQATGQQFSIDTLSKLTNEFIYERDLLKQCKEKKLKRVVIAIKSGQFLHNSSPVIPIHYLVFELADLSLKNANNSSLYDLNWKLNVFHGVLVGLNQLHQQKIFHQDLKPSNVLVFNGNFSKIADLGRATQLGNLSGHHKGDFSYMPIEYYYNHINPNIEFSKAAADLFMVGNILVMMIYNISYLALFWQTLNQNFHPVGLSGQFQSNFSLVLPYLIDAHNNVLQNIKQSIPNAKLEEIIDIINTLCYPDPTLRGSVGGKSKSYHQFSLQPYISKINRLSKTILVRN